MSSKPTYSQLAATAQTLHDNLSPPGFMDPRAFTRLKKALTRGIPELRAFGDLSPATRGSIKKIITNTLTRALLPVSEMKQVEGQCQDIHMVFKVMNEMPGMENLAEAYEDVWELWRDGVV